MKVACADDFFLTRLLDLGYSVWKEKSVPEDWANAVFVLIPKSGNPQALTIGQALPCWTWLEEL